MSVFSALLFAVSANLDAFAVGLAYGLKKVRIGVAGNFIMALIAMVGTGLSMGAGNWLLRWIPGHWAQWLGSGVLFLLGMGVLVSSARSNWGKKREGGRPGILDDPERADKDHSGRIDAREAMLLGGALTINNVGVGVGASTAGILLVPALFCTFFVSLIFLWAGQRLGFSRLAGHLGNYAAPVSGLLLLVLGAIQLFS